MLSPLMLPVTACGNPGLSTFKRSKAVISPGKPLAGSVSSLHALKHARVARQRAILTSLNLREIEQKAHTLTAIIDNNANEIGEFRTAPRQ
jgi:hypothetical protein